MNKNVDVLAEMEHASCRLFDAGLHGELSLDEARAAVAELIEAAKDVLWDLRDTSPAKQTLREALARVKGAA